MSLFQKSNFQKRTVFYAVLFIFLVFFDQLSKNFFSNSPTFLCNQNISLGLVIPSRFFWLLWFIFIFFIIQINPKTHTSQTILIKTFILTGAISNIVDRVRLGCIRDFIPFFNLFYFNIADFLITLGFIFCIFLYLKNKC